MNKYLLERKISLVVMGLGFFISFLGLSNFNQTTLFAIGLPLYILSKYVLSFGVILFVFPGLWGRWKRFFYYVIPITLILMVATPDFVGGGIAGGQLISISDSVRIWGRLFIGIVVFLKVVQSFQRKKVFE